MKNNSAFKFLKISLSIKKINKFLFKNTKDEKNKEKTNLVKNITKFERYKNLIEKFNQFKKDEFDLDTKKTRKSKNKKGKVSIIHKFKKSKKYTKFISKINAIIDINLKSKIKNKINTLIGKNSNIKLNKISLNKFNLFDKFKIHKLFYLNKNKKPKKIDNKYSQKIGIIFYGDHNLILLNSTINHNNQINIIGVTEMPIPSNVIGDTLVEDSNELANILLDSINLLDLSDAPLLVTLSSSFFNIHTFLVSDLKQISESDSKVKAKSPYLPSNTIIDFLRISDKKLSDGLIRTTYSKKDLINSWTDTLQIIDQPLIGLIPAAPHIFDSITSKILEDTTFLIDIESSVTTLLIGSKFAALKSHKLPFGYNLYISDNLKESNKNYFERVLNSIELIINDSNHKLPENIFVMGSGLDKLINKQAPLPNRFKSILDLKLSDYSYSPQKMSIHELVSKSINSNIYSLASILSSCI